MRVHEITCPHCGSGMKSKAGIPAGQTIPCPKCGKKFAVEAADEVEVIDDFEVDEPAPKKKGPPPAPRKKPVRRMEEDETEEDEPLPKRKGGKGKRRPADDTEEEELPRKKKKKKRRPDDDEPEENLFLRLKHNIFVRTITLVILLGVLAILGYLLYEKRMAQEADSTELSLPARIA